MIFQSLVMILRRFFNFGFVAMNMRSKCAKFHKGSPSGKKEVKFNLPSAIDFSEKADFVYNFVYM